MLDAFKHGRRFEPHGVSDSDCDFSNAPEKIDLFGSG